MTEKSSPEFNLKYPDPGSVDVSVLVENFHIAKLPSSPEEPLVPELPEEPLVPELPLEPEVPLVPLVPDEPEVPEEPLVPEVPPVILAVKAEKAICCESPVKLGLPCS